MNNFEKIKSMNIDEMASYIANLCIHSCETCPCTNNNSCDMDCVVSIKQWLESEGK